MTGTFELGAGAAPMPKQPLGRTGFDVTRLALGTYRFTIEFGIPRADALALLERAVSLGINYMDTAPSYGNGESEELIGRTLARHPEQRVFISSKVGSLGRTLLQSAGAEAYRSEDNIRRIVEHSLWLLQRDYLDMLFIHEPEQEVWGWDDKLDAPVLRILEKLRDERIIGAIGLGSNRAEFPGRLAETGRFDVIEIANGYTLMSRAIEDRILPAAREHDIGIVAGGPFRDGMLATVQHDRLEQLKRDGDRSGWYSEGALQQLERFYRLSEETGIAMHELSLRYILSNPAIDTVIPGAQNPGEVDANFQAGLKGPLPDDILDLIRTIQRETPA